jgi:hypothetical protein
MQITDQIIARLKEEKLTLNHYVYLYSLKNELDWAKQLKLNKAAWLKMFSRRNFIVDMKITPKGEALLNGEVYETLEKTEVFVDKNDKKNFMEEKFKEFWNVYPVHDKHGRWKKTRYLRSGKLQAKAKFFEIVTEGVSPNQIINALKTEVKIMKDNSILENKLSYMPLINTWLNKRRYEAFLEEEEEIQESLDPKYGEDIE